MDCFTVVDSSRQADLRQMINNIFSNDKADTAEKLYNNDNDPIPKRRHEMEKRFICASLTCCDFAHRVAAPYLRRAFDLNFTPKSADLKICGLGFYRLWINGREITKGCFAPYISNPDDRMYFDTYDLTPCLQPGENVLGVLLGNGFQNDFGGAVWDFDKAPWRSAPKLAIEFCATGSEETLSFHADGHFLTHPSPILFDEYRLGEIYDARQELPGWNLPGYDTAGWTPALPADAPKGELCECRAEPIRRYETLSPVSVTPCDGGFLYDFGRNTAGICRLHLTDAAPGQTVVIKFCERLRDGKFDQSNLYNQPVEKYPFYFTDFSRVEYRARGGDELYEPSFAWFGYRYAFVLGVRPDQATAGLLSFPVLSSDLRRVGHFSCSDETVNRIFDMIVNSDRSNFYYFPTDCPHREKNGWTGDASLSAPQMSLLFDTTESYLEWLRCVVAAQRADGALPGIVPTSGWGFAWGNGPAWDSVLFNLPYTVWRLRGDTRAIAVAADAMLRYLAYIRTRRSADGTVAIGLGDWVPVGKKSNRYDTPLVVTDSIMVTDMANKAAVMLAVIGRKKDAAIAAALRDEMLASIRGVLLDKAAGRLANGTQTAQAMGLYYGIFLPEERRKAFGLLMTRIRENGGRFDCGFLGLHVLFHVLSEFGEGETAYQMITGKEFPSYRNLLDRGETAMVEAFQPEGGPECGSHNHHFLGDAVRWFFRSLAGLEIVNCRRIRVSPLFVRELDSAEASYELPGGNAAVAWRRCGSRILLTVTHPADVSCDISCDRTVCDVREQITEIANREECL